MQFTGACSDCGGVIASGVSAESWKEAADRHRCPSGYYIEPLPKPISANGTVVHLYCSYRNHGTCQGDDTAVLVAVHPPPNRIDVSKHKPRRKPLCRHHIRKFANQHCLALETMLLGSFRSNFLGRPVEFTSISLVTHCPECGGDFTVPVIMPNGGICHHPTRIISSQECPIR